MPVIFDATETTPVPVETPTQHQCEVTSEDRWWILNLFGFHPRVSLTRGQCHRKAAWQILLPCRQSGYICSNHAKRSRNNWKFGCVHGDKFPPEQCVLIPIGGE